MTVIDTQAAELEGLHKITAEQLALVKRRRQLKARREAIEAEEKEIRDELLKEMLADGAFGLLHNGKAVVRRVEVSSNTIDTKRLKSEFPEIANALVLERTYTRVDIS
jgi:predicted phage-related endonuclease